MANKKITELPSLSGAASVSVDLIPVVDVSADITSSMTRGEFFLNVPSITVTGDATISGLFTSSNVSITGGNITNITDLAVADGGTGLSSYAIGDILYASGTTTLAKLADVATGNVLLSGGVTTAPAYGKVGLTTHVTGTLPVANGGTGQASSLTQYGVVYGSTTSAMATSAAGTATQVLHGNASGAPTFSAVNLTTDVSGQLPLANGGTGINAVSTAGINAALMGYTTVATAAGTTALTNTSTQYQLFTGVTTQTITLPTALTGLSTGWTFHIVNNSTGNLTVNSFGANLVCTVVPNTTAMITCISTSVNTAAAWEFGFTDFGSLTGTGANVLATGPTITAGVYSGTVGASNPSTGAFTTITASGTITDGFATRTAGTLALAFGTNGTVQVTPNATGTFTSTVPAAGTRAILIVLTSGTTSYTMTFGTGFKTTGTLTTGTVAARYYIFQFISDGTSLIEVSRTVAIA
jgi:hypothetical protein